MQTRNKILIGIIVVVVFGLGAFLSVRGRRDRGIEVRTESIERRDLVEIVTASGNIRARRTVDISSDVSARVSELLVDEGDDVVTGQTLLRLEPDQYRAALSRAEALLAQAEAQQAQQQANLVQAERDRDRLAQLRARDSLLVSPQQIDDAETRVEVQQALLQSARFGVSQARAGVDESQDRLSKTIFTAPMDGKVTRLNVEEGETVIIGTMNNPGSLVLTISDLSVIEVVVKVDETEVSEITLGDSASIRIDAFPDVEFAGHVTEIGNSAINPPTQQQTTQQAAIDFEVVLTLLPSEAPLRPDLSATADIVIESRDDVVAVPIIALTVRDRSELEGGDTPTDAADAEGPPPTADAAGDAGAANDVEGVFLVSERSVRFVPVVIGIAGREYFEVLSGLAEGDTVVAGPYQRIRQLKNGDAIRPMEEDTERPGGQR
jgi:HlyD family secretion protein